jgi:protein gp37
MSATSIQWTDRVWNPVTGCTKVSAGCKHCYAEVIAGRFWGTQYAEIETGRHDAAGNAPETRPRQFTDVLTHEDRLREPFSWRKPSRVFVNSMSDLFHEAVPDAFIDRAFAVMALARQHTFQVLTKRPDRMRAYVGEMKPWSKSVLAIRQATSNYLSFAEDKTSAIAFPLPNVWLGVSAENQERADERIPVLLNTPATVRFVSAEPLLGGIDIAKHRPGALGLHWLIAGGESGHGARKAELGWFRNLLGQCRDANVAFFMKQLGAHVTDRNDAGFEGDTPRGWPMDTEYETTTAQNWQGDPVRVQLNDRKGGDMNEWPADLRVREFPTQAEPMRQKASGR